MRRFAALLAILTWSSLLAQLLIYLPATTTGALLPALARFLSFFTILTNILIALVLTACARTGQRAWLADPRAATAVATYAIMVELVYTAFLRWRWNPAGIQLLIDILLHDIIPIAYIIFWAACIKKGTLRWLHALLWLAYPLAFILWNWSLSAATHRRTAYPFLDLEKTGILSVAGFIILLAIAFWLTGIILIAIDRALAPSRR